MKKTVNRISILVLIAVFSISLSTTGTNVSVGKTSISDLEEQMEENEKAIKKAQEDILSKNTEISLVQSEIAKAEVRINEFNQTIFDLDNRIEVKEAEITFTENKLTETIQEEDEYFDLTKERIKVMYEYGTTEYLEVLLESKDTSDFFNRLEYLNKLVSYDQSMLDELDELEASIIDYENQLIGEKVELEDLKMNNTISKNDVEEAQKQKEEEILKIEDDKEMLATHIKEMEEEQEAIDASILELIALYADDRLFGDGKLDWPAPGYNYISSYFGPRIHPVYGYKSTHTGIDIPAGYGKAIVASASGKVIFAGWGNAYGNYILIDHGRDDQGRHIITQYAHCSSLLVVEGDLVLRGDQIAKAGSTGWSTGNHLHFGVQLGGNWINPLDKLDR